MGKTMRMSVKLSLLVAAMGEAGRRKVVERYQWDRIIDRWEEIYRNIDAERRAT